MNAIHKRDPLSFVSGVYNDFNEPLSTCRHNDENVEILESRFEAQLSRINSHGAWTILESLTALTKLSNANLEDSQRVSVLAASVSNVPGIDGGTAPSSASHWRKGNITAVLRPCDKSKPSASHNNGNSTLNANRGGGVNGTNGRNQRDADSQRTPEQMATLKDKFECHRCHLYGHWANEHNPDGTLKLRCEKLSEALRAEQEQYSQKIFGWGRSEWNTSYAWFYVFICSGRWDVGMQYCQAWWARMWSRTPLWWRRSLQRHRGNWTTIVTWPYSLCSNVDRSEIWWTPPLRLLAIWKWLTLQFETRTTCIGCTICEFGQSAYYLNSSYCCARIIAMDYWWQYDDEV